MRYPVPPYRGTVSFHDGPHHTRFREYRGTVPPRTIDARDTDGTPGQYVLSPSPEHEIRPYVYEWQPRPRTGT